MVRRAIDPVPNLKIEIALLGVFALLWGSPYLFIKVAAQETPLVTLIAARVSVAAVFLLLVASLRNVSLPTTVRTSWMLSVQAFFTSMGAWLVLAWGQQYVDSGLASILNSTAPIFVFILTTSVACHESQHPRKLAGAVLGVIGVALIVGIDALNGLG